MFPEDQPAQPTSSDTSIAVATDTSSPPTPTLISPGRWLLVVGLIVGLLVALLLWYYGPVSPRSENFKPELVIIQLNDTYRVDAVENGKVGGLGRVATLIKQTQEQTKNVLLVHAGDFIAPSLESKVFHGKQMIDALNYLNRLTPLYVVPGNHEFDDDDSEMVVNAMERSNFEWLGSNVKINSGRPSMRQRLQDNRLVRVGRVTVGIFALTLHGDHGGKDQKYAPVEFEDKYCINDVSLEGMADELPNDTLQKVRVLRNQQFQTRQQILAALSAVTGIQDNEALSSLADYASIGYTSLAERQIQELEKWGADIIIALTHLNMPDDRQIAQLRRAHPKFMWIAGGHEHYAQHEALSADTALITKGDSNARRVWRVAIGFNNGVLTIREERVDLNDSTFKPDEGYQSTIAENYRTVLLEKFSYLDEVVGNTKSLNARCLEGDEDTIRNAPSNWGSYIADQMRNTNGQGKMQIGLLHGGGIRIDDRPCGDLSFEHLERTFGFKTEVVYIKLTGEDLKQRILENAVAGKRGAGRFLQFAGITFMFDRHRLPGDRVFDIKVQKGSAWVEFDKNELYSIAVPRWLYEGNDGYAFKDKVKFLLPACPDARVLVYNALQGVTAQTKPDAITVNLKVGAVELPEYAKATIPKIDTWKAAPLDLNKFCPK
ncbi:MAG TPA: 5'-nucleotidase C-terminal domain-containing protein [Pyrinomonadaceae bacterium]|nr:5'-nucleotidase C-terminal domain-containing protein [Pyrinomonadaceae bacterium]